jgi:hypothetical protein
MIRWVTAAAQPQHRRKPEFVVFEPGNHATSALTAESRSPVSLRESVG